MARRNRMNRWLAGLLCSLLAVLGSGVQPVAAQMLMNGAGATFPYPIYSKWFDEYARVDQGARFNYQSIGSGGGIRQITARTVDFGASDGPMTDAQVGTAPGALGYVELAYAIKNNLPAASVRNAAGKFVEPSIETTTAAAAASATNMPADFRVSLTNPPGDHAYPIASFTWLLVYKDQPDETKGKLLVKFLWWMIHDGQKYTSDLLYAPLPPQVVKQVEARLGEITYQGKPLLAAR